MNRRSWKVWVASLALALLLAAGGAALMPLLLGSQADQAAAMLEVGMPWQSAIETLRTIEGAYNPRRGQLFVLGPQPSEHVEVWVFRDLSSLHVTFRGTGPDELVVIGVRSVPTPPPPWVSDLRRTLARAFPFLAE
jgi:hypothetical protein